MRSATRYWMLIRHFAAVSLLAAALVPGCSIDRPSTAPAANTDADKDKRGNTPPGTARSGDTPAAGAIVDPTGAVTKDPVKGSVAP